MNIKKIMIVEYDVDGNEIEKNCLVEHRDIIDLYRGGYNLERFPKRFLLDKLDRDIFTEKQWLTIERSDYPDMIDIHFEKNNFFKIEFIHADINTKSLAIWKSFFKESKEKQKFILGIYGHLHYPSWQWIINMKTKLNYEREDFKSCYDWVNKTNGLYYAVDNNGTRTWDFIDVKPTEKQAKYQRVTNGRRIIFLSFNDWKEYTVNEDEL